MALPKGYKSMNNESWLKVKSRALYHRIGRLMPTLFMLSMYYRGSKRMGNAKKERDLLFNELISSNKEKKCIQIGVKDDDGDKFGENWVAVDLYDMSSFIDFHYDVRDLQFDDGEFDIAVCLSILEHIQNPQVAIKELYRVLKPGGVIWVQVPFHFPYHESPKDYWRVSPDGLREWMSDFEEIRCGSLKWTRTSLATTSFFYGRKSAKKS